MTFRQALVYGAIGAAVALGANQCIDKDSLYNTRKSSSTATSTLTVGGSFDPADPGGISRKYDPSLTGTVTVKEFTIDTTARGGTRRKVRFVANNQDIADKINATVEARNALYEADTGNPVTVKQDFETYLSESNPENPFKLSDAVYKSATPTLVIEMNKSRDAIKARR